MKRSTEATSTAWSLTSRRRSNTSRWGAVPGTAGVYRGPEGLKEFMGWFGEFSGARAEINELIDAGDQVLVGITARGRGKQSGVESGWHLWHVWTLRGGKIVRGEGFTDRDKALEAAGLSE
jgi:uncharacterized protein